MFITLGLMLSSVTQPATGYVVASTATTEMLVKECGPSGPDLTINFCTGYVLATFDSLSSHRIICPSDSVTSEQTMAVARRYLADHPEIWDRAPSFVVEEAMRTAYPCR